MTLVTFQDGKPVMRDGKIGTEHGCCCGCDKCTQGRLPDSVSVTFANMNKRAYGPSLITVGTAGGCFGSGAAGAATLPVGDTAGPLGPIQVTNGGSGYAIKHRVEPEVSADVGTVTLVSTNDSCGIPSWSVESVALAEGGEYENGQLVVFATEDTEELTAGAVIRATRGEPTLSASATPGSGATFLIAYTQNNVSPQTWSISSIAITNAGSGYEDEDDIVFTLGDDDVEVTAATAKLSTRAQPTLTASVSGGDGEELTVAYQQASGTGGAPGWRVQSVAVANGGTGHTDGAAVTFSIGSGDSQIAAAAATIVVGREAPTEWTVEPIESAGSGLELSATTSQVTVSGTKYWKITAVSVTTAGTGYAVDDTVYVVPADGEAFEISTFRVTSVGTGGTVTGLELIDEGLHFRSTGVIESINVTSQGFYYKSTDTAQAVRVINAGEYYNSPAGSLEVDILSPGKYYRETLDAPYVASVTATIAQSPPSNGSGADVDVVIDEDPTSETFGQVTAFTVSSSGSGYLARSWGPPWCGDDWDGLTVICNRTGGCEYAGQVCSAGSIAGYANGVLVTYNGPSSPPTVQITGEVSGTPNSIMCGTLFTTSDLVADCDDFSFTANSLDATATVAPSEPGDPSFRNPDYLNNGYPSCHICCLGDEQVSDEITVTISRGAAFGIGEGETETYSLERLPPGPVGGTGDYRYLNWAYSDNAGTSVRISIRSKWDQNADGWIVPTAGGVPESDENRKTCAIFGGMSKPGWLSAYTPIFASDYASTPRCNPTGEITVYGYIFPNIFTPVPIGTATFS